MARIILTEALRAEYVRLFETCEVSPRRAEAVEGVVRQVLSTRERYQAVEQDLGVPWYFLATVHSLESSLRFDRHLHNGDSLKRRTVNVPAGRPRTGQPPFTWEESAADTLRLKRLDANTDWTLPGILHQLERYNGWGYRLYHSQVHSPYLWSFSQHYTRGKYVADGRWSDTAVSQQCGAAVILRRLVELGEVVF